MATKKKTTSTAGIKSLRTLATALGVAASTCSGYLKREDWPASISRKAPWAAAEVAMIKAWRANLQEDRSGKAEATGNEAAGGVSAEAGMSAKSKVDTLLKMQRARYAKVQADAAEGKVIPRELLENGLAALATMFVQIGDDVFESLPHKLDGSPAKNEPVCREAWHDWRQKIIDHYVLDLAKLDERVIQATRKAGGSGR